jgi:serine/threonine-protein phosphatase 2B catalytic subunit
MIRSPGDVNRLERLEEPPNYGPMCDLLWSDPLEMDSSMKPQEFREEYYRDNAGRGCGQMFGPAAVRDFLDDNEVVCIIRAHEVMKEGFREYRFMEDARPVPMVITLFSAPNYLGSYENKAAMLTVADLSRSISQIVWTTPPFAMPEADNMLVLGLGHIAESVMGFFVSVFDAVVRKAEDAPPDAGEDEEPLNFSAIRAKVEAMAMAMVRIRARRKTLLRKKLGLPTVDVTVKSSDEAFERTLQAQRESEANPKLI